MKLNLLKISALFFILLIIVPTIFIATSDFVVAKPLGLPTVDLIEISKEVSEADERISPIIRSLFHAVNVLLIFLIISLIILNWAAGIGMYIGLGSLGYVFYDIGYAWSLGVINMLFVIAFVFAALLYILDVEWGIVDKKTLPRLVIVALLINFSSLFVKIIIDFFIIFERGVLEQLLPGGLFIPLRTIGTQSLLNWFTLVLLSYVRLIITELVATIVGFFAFGIPSFILTIKQYVAAPIIITPFVMEIISNFLLFAVFSIYAVLFFARSIILGWYLMLAPVAIACTVFPKTRSFFDGWLKQLLLWGAMGTILFIVLSFGFHIRSFIVGGFNIALTKGFGVGVGGIMIFVANFFFAIYSIVSFFMIKKYLPSAAQGGIDMLQKGAMLAGGAAAGAVGGVALAKYGTGIREKLGSIQETVGVDSFASKMIGGVKKKIEKAEKQQLETDSEVYDGMTEEKKIEHFQQGDETKKKAVLHSMRKEGHDITLEKIEDAGMTAQQFKELNLKTMSEKEYKDNYKHIHSIQKMQKNTDDKEKCEKFKRLNDALEEKGALYDKDLMEYNKLKKELATEMNINESDVSSKIEGEIKKREVKIKQDLIHIAQTNDYKTIGLITKGIKDKYPKLLGQLEDIIIERGDENQISSVSQKEIGKLKELLQRKIAECGGDEQKIKNCIGRYKKAFMLYAGSEDIQEINVSSLLINKTADGYADENEVSILIDQLNKDGFKTKKTQENKKEKDDFAGYI